MEKRKTCHFFAWWSALPLHHTGGSVFSLFSLGPRILNDEGTFLCACVCVWACVCVFCAARAVCCEKQKCSQARARGNVFALLSYNLSPLIAPCGVRMKAAKRVPGCGAHPSSIPGTWRQPTTTRSPIIFFLSLCALFSAAVPTPSLLSPPLHRPTHTPHLLPARSLRPLAASSFHAPEAAAPAAAPRAHAAWNEHQHHRRHLHRRRRAVAQSRPARTACRRGRRCPHPHHQVRAATGQGRPTGRLSSPPGPAKRTQRPAPWQTGPPPSPPGKQPRARQWGREAARQRPPGPATTPPPRRRGRPCFHPLLLQLPTRRYGGCGRRAPPPEPTGGPTGGSERRRGVEKTAYPPERQSWPPPTTARGRTPRRRTGRAYYQPQMRPGRRRGGPASGRR